MCVILKTNLVQHHDTTCGFGDEFHTQTRVRFLALSTFGGLLTLICCLAGWLTGCAGQPARDPSETTGYLIGAEGARIYYEVRGGGADTLLVVHGGPGAGMNDIAPDLEPLTGNHAVIYYDQRGGGRSELPADTSFLAARYFVEDLEAVRAFFELGTVRFVAHSFGAVLVAAYAVKHPDRVDRIVLLGATGPSREEAAKFYGARRPTTDTARARRQHEILDSLMSGIVSDPVEACKRYESLGKQIAAARGDFVGWKGSTCNMPLESVQYYYRYTAEAGPRSFGNWDFTRSLQRLQAPVLVIDGELDREGLAMEEAWVQAVPNGRLFLVPDAGRAAYAERPHIVFGAIDEFLTGKAPGF